VRAAYQRLEADLLVSIRTKHGTVVLPHEPGTFKDDRSGISSFLIGVILPAPTPVFNAYLQGISHAASESRLLPIICYTYDNPHLTDRYLNQLLAKNVDGFIVTSTSSDKFVENPALIDTFPATVFVDTPDIPRNSLLFDSEQASFLATCHLLEHGYKEIGLITPPLDWANVTQCYAGYQQALAKYNMPFNPDWMVEVPDFYQKSGYEGALELLKRGRPPRAIYAISDLLAIGAIQALHGGGFSVPGDVAIASYNDIEQAALARPALTSASLPAYEMGVQAVNLLNELLGGGKPTQEPRRLTTSLVIRESCGCQAEI
jgi:DNA-binding LacI/PurR family transcriptional regulator